ncbi:hypothetical protein ACFU99_04695 [Streptomyces sp. NPDC057654]|uniref:hypothetical protein n=1 Tax=Streptomyces sp. NPDC057654 TaxID=3346196 RepID=UPI00367F6036
MYENDFNIDVEREAYNRRRRGWPRWVLVAEVFVRCQAGDRTWVHARARRRIGRELAAAPAFPRIRGVARRVTVAGHDVLVTRGPGDPARPLMFVVSSAQTRASLGLIVLGPHVHTFTSSRSAPPRPAASAPGGPSPGRLERKPYDDDALYWVALVYDERRAWMAVYQSPDAALRALVTDEKRPA